MITKYNQSCIQSGLNYSFWRKASFESAKESCGSLLNNGRLASNFDEQVVEGLSKCFPDNKTKFWIGIVKCENETKLKWLDSSHCDTLTFIDNIDYLTKKGMCVSVTKPSSNSNQLKAELRNCSSRKSYICQSAVSPAQISTTVIVSGASGLLLLIILGVIFYKKFCKKLRSKTSKCKVANLSSVHMCDQQNTFNLVNNAIYQR